METPSRNDYRSEDRAAPLPVDAIVLAGSMNRIPLFPGNRPGRKALVPIQGRPLIAFALDALTKARSVGRTLVVGSPEVLEYATRWPRVDGLVEGTSLVDNAWRGLEASASERVLFCNPDQPLLTPEMVDFFVEQAVRRDADLVTSWARLEDLGAYTEGHHKFARFGDGEYAHGNLFLARRRFPNAPQVRRRLDRLYGARKNVYRFAWELGPELFLRFLVSLVCRRLPSLENALEIGGRSFGISMAGVVCPHPEIVLDIDEPEDYAAAERYLSWQEPSQAAAGRR